MVDILAPQNSSSCGELACFAHSYISFANISLIVKIIITIATTTFNKNCPPPFLVQKCLSPLISSDCEMFAPKGQTNEGDEIVTYVHTNGCSVLYIDVGIESSIILLRAAL